MRNTRMATLIIFCLIIALTGCNKKKNTPNKQTTYPSVKANFVTPEDAFNGMQAALKVHNWGGAYDCMTEEGKDGMALSVLFMMTPVVQAGSEWKTKADALTEKYGIGEKAMKDRERSKDPAEDFKIVAGMITDKRAFCAEGMELICQHNPGFKDSADRFEKINDVKVDGDKATGVVTDKGEGGKEFDINFKKVGSYWLIDSQARPRMTAIPKAPETPATPPAAGEEKPAPSTEENK